MAPDGADVSRLHDGRTRARLHGGPLVHDADAGVASSLALVLGAVGLYGMLSYVVAERTREIGVRMALGARTDQVRRMVVFQGVRVVGAGVALGAVVAALSTGALRSLLFEVRTMDAATFAAMSAAMLAIGFVASYLPARRASRIDPVVSLRGD